jgi:hypothetical protein
VAGTAATTQLELELTKLIAVLGPLAKAILCLESAHSTCADVYLFWIAALASIEDLFRSGSSGLGEYAIRSIRAIANKRFDQMINDGPTDIYLTSFFLDPREYHDNYWLVVKLLILLDVGYRSCKVFRTREFMPTKVPTIWVPGSNSVKGSGMSVAARDRLAKCLVSMLEAEYEMGENPLLTGISGHDAVASLGPQMMAYERGEYPFNREFHKNETVLDWWKAIQPNSLASVLGVCPYFCCILVLS